MQALNVKQTTNQELANKAINQALIQKTENTKTKVDDSKTHNVVELTKTESFNRFLEAYSDCV
jgi:alpha-tubulin suppressor-like RCC1 family protein